jgi:malate dehydrogenase (oxaloacetate-decarboxylating)(NADP+)
MSAAAARFPHAVIHLEDFANTHAFRLLARYGRRLCIFDDDIQGTGSVALAGVYSALRITGGALADQRLLFVGAGEAAIGIARVVVAAMREEGVAEADARARCWFYDSKGPVVASRADLAEHKRAFAREGGLPPDLPSAVAAIRPTILVGASGVPGAFSRDVLEAAARVAERPVVMALSNPTSKAECTAEQAYAWIGGRAVFASGSPFAPVDVGGRTYAPGQANNVYIFPGVGLGAIVSEAAHITDEMFLVAAKTLAAETLPADFEVGRVYPGLDRIREVSTHIAVAVAEVAYDLGLARRPRPDDLAAAVRAEMFDPDYSEYV